MRRRVVHQVARPHRHLDDRGQTAVAVRVVPGAEACVVRHARVRRPRARRRHHMHPGPGRGPARGVRGAGLHRDVQLRRGLGERLGETGDVLRQLHPAAAQIGAVQGHLEVGPQLVDHAGQGAGLGRQPVGRQHRRRPLRLLLAGRPEEAQVVVEQTARRRGDMEARPVGIRAQQEVPGRVRPQLPLVQDPFGDGERARGRRSARWRGRPRPPGRPGGHRRRTADAGACPRVRRPPAAGGRRRAGVRPEPVADETSSVTVG